MLIKFINYILEHTYVITSFIAPIIYGNIQWNIISVRLSNKINVSINTALYAIVIQLLLELVKKFWNSQCTSIKIISSLNNRYVESNTTNLELDNGIGKIFFKIIINGKVNAFEGKKIMINFPKQVDLDYTEKVRQYEITNNCNVVINLTNVFNTNKDRFVNDAIEIEVGVQQSTEHVNGTVNVSIEKKKFLQNIDINETNISGIFKEG